MRVVPRTAQVSDPDLERIARLLQAYLRAALSPRRVCHEDVLAGGVAGELCKPDRRARELATRPTVGADKPVKSSP
jgi:hypothetical protein